MSVIGLQLYSIKEEMEKDFFGSLEKVKQAGYDAVEFAGFYGHSAKELKSALANIGLAPYSAHVALDKDPAGMAKFAADLGLRYAITPWASCGTLEDCLAANASLKAAASIFAAEGITVGYHNHWDEFVKYDGRYALDIIMDGVDGVYQLDIGWVAVAGVDVLEYMRGLGNRIGPIHAKDLNADYATRDPAAVDACIGEGVLDIAAIIEHMRATDTLSRGLIVEQEAFAVPMFEALARNASALRAMTTK